MTTKLLLHIGTEKTGTTSLQRFFHRHRGVLRARGILYPSCLGGPGHKKLAAAALPYYLYRDFSERVTVERLLESLRREIRAAAPRIVVLSAEQLSSRLLVEHIKALRRLVDSLDLDPQVVVYLRRQDDMFAGSYSTAVKGRHHKVMDVRVAVRRRRRYDYLRLLTRWSRHFPGPVVRVLEPGRLREGSLFADFWSLVSDAPCPLPEPRERENASLAPDLLEFKRRANVPIWRGGLPDWEARRASKLLLRQLQRLESPFSRYGLLSAEQRETILAAHSESNAEVASAYLGWSTPLFQVELARSRPVYRDAGPEEMARIAAALELGRSWRDRLEELWIRPVWRHG